MKNIIILTHKNCMDGFGAAWVLYYYYYLQENRNIKYSLKYIFVEPSHPEDAIQEFKNYTEKFGCFKAYSFDIGFHYQHFQELINIFSDIKILDHHISSYNDILKNFNNNISLLPKNYFFDNDKSGSILAWEYFYPDLEPPKLLKYIEDRDLWKFQLKDSRLITEGIYNLLSIGDFVEWTKFVENEESYLKKCKELGSVLRDIKEQRNAILVDQGKEIVIYGKKAYVVNTTENISDLGNYICNLRNENGDFLVDYAMIWRHNMSENKTYVSLRSHPDSDVDVSKIAKSLSTFAANMNTSKKEKKIGNGGGHKHAAGFSCDDIFAVLSTLRKE